MDCIFVLARSLGLATALAAAAGAAAATIASAAPPAAVAAQAPAPAAALQERLARARAGLLSGTSRPNEVINELKAILAVDPDAAEGHLLLGLAYRSIGSNDMLPEAIAEFRQALALDGRLVAGRFYLASAYLDLGRAERARDELELALAQLPGNAQFTTLLAEAERRSGNPARGLELAEQILKADPAAAEARYYAAMSLVDLKRRPEAIAQFEQLVRAGVTMVEVTSALGNAYLDENRLDESVQLLAMAAGAAPERADIRVSLARAYRRRGQLTEAEAQLALALPPGAAMQASAYYEALEADVHFETGLIRLQQQRLADATTSLAKAAELRPADGPTHRYLAEAYLRQGQQQLAIAHAARARAAGATLPDDLRALLPPSPPSPQN